MTDSESKLKTPVGIKGHCFIRIIHSNTINSPLLGGVGGWEGRVYTREKERSRASPCVAFSYLHFPPNNFIDATRAA